MRCHRCVVLTVRNEVQGPLLVMLGVWIAAAAVTTVFARSSWLWAAALGAVLGASVMFLWLARPRPGELVRLVLDGRRRQVYWSHCGRDPEELPYSALRAVVIESPPRGTRVRLHAVDLEGRWVTLGSGPRVHLEPFARELAARVGIALWSRRLASGSRERLTELVLMHRDESGMV